MATTWKITRAEVKDTMKYVTLQEDVDGVSGSSVTIKMHRTAPLSEMQEKMKALIVPNRSALAENEKFRAEVEKVLGTFETYLKG